MTTKEALEQVLQDLPEDRLHEVLNFARFLGWQEDRESWQQFGREQLAKAYGSDEPDYTADDIKPELNS
jgi:hypothetical protein